MRRLIRLAAASLLLRWAAGEIAAYASRRRHAPGPPPVGPPPSTL